MSSFGALLCYINALNRNLLPDTYLYESDGFGRRKRYNYTLRKIGRYDFLFLLKNVPNLYDFAGCAAHTNECLEFWLQFFLSVAFFFASSVHFRASGTIKWNL